MSSKRNALNLSDRYKVINLSEKGLSVRKIAGEFKVGKSQISNILKRKADILKSFKENGNNERKRQCRSYGNDEINNLTWLWFQDAISRRLPVSGPLLQERALKFATDLGITEFKGSNGWLESFLKRHNITFGAMSGERGDVNLLTFIKIFCTF